MKTVSEHIAHLKEQPHHVRERVVFAAAGLGTALIALVWLVGSLSMGSFALQGSTFADIGRPAAGVDRPAADVAGIAGAAAAIPDSNVPAHIEIIDTSPVPAGKPSEQTVLPF